MPVAEALLFLPDTARAILADMGDSADREVAMSQQDREIATEASRQAHYILWSKIMGISDPCGSNQGYERVGNIYHVSPIWSELHEQGWTQGSNPGGYAKAILILFKLQGFPSPVDPSDPKNMGVLS